MDVGYNFNETLYIQYIMDVCVWCKYVRIVQVQVGLPLPVLFSVVVEFTGVHRTV